jgi:hypothetical protein
VLLGGRLARFALSGFSFATGGEATSGLAFRSNLSTLYAVAVSESAPAYVRVMARRTKLARSVQSMATETTRSIPPKDPAKRRGHNGLGRTQTRGLSDEVVDLNVLVGRALEPMTVDLPARANSLEAMPVAPLDDREVRRPEIGVAPMMKRHRRAAGGEG